MEDARVGSDLNSFDSNWLGDWCTYPSIAFPWTQWRNWKEILRGAKAEQTLIIFVDTKIWQFALFFY